MAPLCKVVCKISLDTNGLFRKLRHNVLLIHYSRDRSGGGNEEWEGETMAFFFFFPLLFLPCSCFLACGRSWKAVTRRRESQGRGGRAAWGCRAPATVTAPRSASPCCFLLQQGTSEFSSITANVTTPPTSKPGPVPGKTTRLPLQL